MNRHYVFIIAAAALWGTIGVFVKDLTALGFSSMQLVACRAVVTAAVLFFVILIADAKKLRIRLRDIWIFAGMGICSFAFFNYCYFYAIGRAGMTVAAILLYTSPIFVTLLSAALFKERLTGNKLVALPLAVAGCVLASGVASGGSGPDAAGLIAGVLSGFGYALYSIFGRVALRRYDTLTVTFYTFVFAAAVTAPLAGPAQFAALVTSWGTAGRLAALGVFSCVLPYLLYTAGLSGVETSKASIIACCEPVVAAAIGILVYGEPAPASRLLGMALVMAAIVVLNFKLRRNSVKQ